MHTVRLIPGKERRINAGHLWVYRGELDPGSLPAEAGPVRLLTARGKELGFGDYSPHSTIAVRLLPSYREEVETGWLRDRLRSAADWRRENLGGEQSYRAVFGEGDLLPGLVVDKFGDYLAVQILTAAMDRRKEVIFDLLMEIFRPKGIVERSDVSVRKHEGLPLWAGVVRGEVPEEVVFEENGLKLKTDLVGGQKTGYFLDQKFNRRALAPYAKGAKVLDTFCHVGGFALHAALYGAAESTGVDISEEAVAAARENAAANHLSNCRFIAENAFDFLRRQVDEKVQYDLVILDPPAFTKNKAAVEAALRGYKEINLRGLKLLPPGGILVTCSCSHHIAYPLFQAVVEQAAADAGRRVRMIERRSQSPDHPILIGVPETEYLKCLVMQVIE
jgi:23S rRNA (cytosine1962-C5)-methyltransferase